ncbi:hypothetical protein VTG60DRAFT_4786 [Thermothelomyces hinnuleus]
MMSNWDRARGTHYYTRLHYIVVEPLHNCAEPRANDPWCTSYGTRRRRLFGVGVRTSGKPPHAAGRWVRVI